MRDMYKESKNIFESLVFYAEQDPVRMHMPGHKGHSAPREGTMLKCEGFKDSSAFEKLSFALNMAKTLDVTEIRGLDNLHYPNGSIEATQRSMSKTFGSAATYCLVNGATCGVLASIIALKMTMGPGMVIVPRNAHRSIVSGLILSGLEPFFVYPRFDKDFGGYLPLTLSDIEGQLRDEARLKQLNVTYGGLLKGIKGILIVNPSYFGVHRDITDICNFAERTRVPVIVDEAHGTLFSLSKSLPASAIQKGASLVIHGAHKTTEAFTQTGLLHITLKGLKRFPALHENVRESLRLVQSTSPSYVLLASLERAIENLKTDSTWIEEMIQLSQLLRDTLSCIDGICVRIPEKEHGLQWDPGKLLIDVSGLGLNGAQVRDLLWEEGRIVPEMVGPDYVLLMITGADASQGIERIVKAFREISKRYFMGPCRKRNSSGMLTEEPPRGEMARPLSQAFYSQSTAFSLEEAIGKVSCDTVLIYPPGSPVIVPGERIKIEMVKYLREAIDCGLAVLGRGYSSVQEELRIFCAQP